MGLGDEDFGGQIGLTTSAILVSGEEATRTAGNKVTREKGLEGNRSLYLPQEVAKREGYTFCNRIFNLYAYLSHLWFWRCTVDCLLIVKVLWQ